MTSLFLDFRKAFDCLNYDLLLKKLNNLGVTRIRQLRCLQNQKSGLDTAKSAYFALFESYQKYSIAVWGGITGTSLEGVLLKKKKNEQLDA